MKSQTRQDCEYAEWEFSQILRKETKRFEQLSYTPTMLMVGTAGNPLTHNGKPGLDHPERFSQYFLMTADFDAKWNPDFVMDIIKPYDHKILYKFFDLIHIVQVIEHIKEIWKLPEAFMWLLKDGGYVIVDAPWGTKSPGYHGEPPSFGDYWRISKDGMTALFGEKFEIVRTYDTDANTSCLLKMLS